MGSQVAHINYLATELHLTLRELLNNLRVQQLTILESQDYESRAPIRRTVFEIIYELGPICVRQSPRVYPIPRSVVVGIGSHLQAMEMSSYDCFAAAYSIVVGCMDATLIAVLDHHILREPGGPAGNPCWKMILQVEPSYPLKLTSVLSQPVLEPGIMVSERPN